MMEKFIIIHDGKIDEFDNKEDAEMFYTSRKTCSDNIMLLTVIEENHKKNSKIYQCDECFIRNKKRISPCYTKDLNNPPTCRGLSVGIIPVWEELR